MAAQLAEKIILGIDPGTNVMGYGVIKVEDKKATIVTMGVIDMRKESDMYLKLGHIFQRVNGIIESYLPDEMAIEAPFFGKNVQSMLKLGRAQGVAIAAAINHSVPITEYAPMKIKMAITGTGTASKEQVAGMLQRILHLDQDDMPKFPGQSTLGKVDRQLLIIGNKILRFTVDYVNGRECVLILFAKGIHNTFPVHAHFIGQFLIGNNQNIRNLLQDMQR